MIEPVELPYSLQLEGGILGCILLQPVLLKRLDFLHPDHFHSTAHAEIFAKMRQLHEDGEPISPFTVVPDAESVQALKITGGVLPYFGGLISAANLVIDAEREARLLVGMAHKRDLIRACQTTIAAATNEADDRTAEEHTATLSSHLESVMKRCGGGGVQDDYEVTDAILKDMLDDRPPVSTGLPRLDTAMGGGLFPGRAYGFAARKKVGKTIMAATISCNLAMNGIKHLFICGEMGPKEIHQRNLARLTSAFPSDFRKPAAETAELRRKIADVALQSKRCILYCNAPGLYFEDLKRIASESVFRHGIKGLILDYWQLVGGKAKGQSTAEHLDEVAQWIADFGRKHGIWSITMAQLNQEGNTRGGEGIRLAFDQVYALRGMGQDEDITYPQRWLEMVDTRYTKWLSLGSSATPGLQINERGPFFEEYL